MTTPRYTIRLRHAGSGVIAEDSAGDAYIVSGQGLQCRLTGLHTLGTLAPTLRALSWVAVPPAAPYTLDDLLCLLAPVPPESRTRTRRAAS